MKLKTIKKLSIHEGKRGSSFVALPLIMLSVCCKVELKRTIMEESLLEGFSMENN